MFTKFFGKNNQPKQQTQTEVATQEVEFDIRNASAEQVEKIYAEKFAKEDAQALYEVLGNEEMVVRTIEGEGIESKKWEYVFVELYSLLNKTSKKDAQMLKGAYFDITKLADFSILWEGFPNHQEMIKTQKTIQFVDFLTEKINESGFAIEDVVAELQSRLHTPQAPVVTVKVEVVEPETPAENEVAVPISETPKAKPQPTQTVVSPVVPLHKEEVPKEKPELVQEEQPEAVKKEEKEVVAQETPEHDEAYYASLTEQLLGEDEAV